MVYSDHRASERELSELSLQLGSLFKSGEKFSLDEEIVSHVGKQMLEPSWRDLMTILKNAKGVFLEKKVDFHFFGTDGYEHQVLSIKSGKEFDEICTSGGNDLFFFRFYEKGDKIDYQVTKPTWYALRDQLMLEMRGSINPSIDQMSKYGRELAQFVIESEHKARDQLDSSPDMASNHHRKSTSTFEENRGALDGLSPDMIAIFDKFSRFIRDEDAQNDRLMSPAREAVKQGLSCNQIPNGVGQFGREKTNPIPVNGLLGELLYLSNLRHSSGQPIVFHRLGSLNGVDVYETMTFDGDFWDIFYLDFDHPRKSRSAPDGYSITFAQLGNFYGTNKFVADFPREIPSAVDEVTERVIGIGMRPPQIRAALEGKLFVRPGDHARLIFSLVNQIAEHRALSAHDQSMEASNSSQSESKSAVANNVETEVVSLKEGQDRLAREIEALPDEIALKAYAALVSIVHQMDRLAAGHGPSVALNEIEIFVKSFEKYIDNLDELNAEQLKTDYDVAQRCMNNLNIPFNLNHGAQALMVLILGEMIRREGKEQGFHDMSGYERAHAMLNRLAETVT